MQSLPPRPDVLLPPPPYGPRPPSTPPPRRRRGLTVLVVVLTLSAILAAGLIPIVPNLVHPAASGTARYTFILQHDGGGVRWNPCEPIHYVVNLGGAPEGSLEDVQESVRRITAATGIAFAYDGLSDEVPMEGRAAYQPDRYGDRWAPVLIAWVAPSQTDIPFQKDGETAAGVASPQLPRGGFDEIYVSGWAAINVNDSNPPGFDRYGEQGLVVLHELSHVMGMGHVKQWGELMEPSGGGVTDFGPGDREGLELLGRSQGCLTTPEPR
jgi:hypothetical protein